MKFKPIEKAIAFDEKINSLGFSQNIEYKLTPLGNLIALLRLPNDKPIVFDFFGFVPFSETEFKQEWDKAKLEFNDLSLEAKEAFLRKNKNILIPDSGISMNLDLLKNILQINGAYKLN